MFFDQLGELRYEPVDKRIRATLRGAPVLDSRRPVLVWEPKRVVASYAIPEPDISATVRPTASAPADDPARRVEIDGRPVLDPSIPFAVHTAPGDTADLEIAGEVLPGAAFRCDDPALAGYLIIDFDACDAWYEEDERNFGHPRDPFHRIEVVHSSRHVRVESEGVLLAESRSPYLLYESMLPVRYYLPPSDVDLSRLEASRTRTTCAYKGHASYWSRGGRDLAWSYPDPQREAAEVRERVAFFNERVDLVVDGLRLERPITPWS
jgi:uncharacterized protein (DUF427 family)